MVETMLLVDDFDIERDMLQDLLQDSFSIIQARNGKECINIIKQEKRQIDVVLLDLMMPVMNGFEVLEARKSMSRFKDIPVIVLTSSDDLQDQVRCFNLGASDFITKPIIAGIAISRIKNVIASKLRLAEMKKEIQKYSLESEYDLMTGLYNKPSLEKRIHVELRENPDRMHALMSLDLDDLKEVNQKLGREEGDRTIRIVADFITTFFRKSDVIGRLEGDKFLVFMTGMRDKDIARMKAKDIARQMKYKPDLTLSSDITLSIGLAFSDYENCSYESLLMRAEEALFMAKQTGKCKMSEYGIEEPYKKDDRKKIIVLSMDKKLCSMVDSVAAEKYAMRQVTSVDEYIAYVCNGRVNLNDIVKFIIDVSEAKSDTVGIWEKLKRCVPSSGRNKDGDSGKVIAICREGDMNQYRQAVLSEIASDIISAPVNLDQLKRRLIDTL